MTGSSFPANSTKLTFIIIIITVIFNENNSDEDITNAHKNCRRRTKIEVQSCCSVPQYFKVKAAAILIVLGLIWASYS